MEEAIAPAEDFGALMVVMAAPAVVAAMVDVLIMAASEEVMAQEALVGPAAPELDMPMEATGAVFNSVGLEHHVQYDPAI